VTRPAVDVVVPFLGDDSALSELRRRLIRLELRGGDTVTVVDNRRTATEQAAGGGPTVVAAPQRQTPYLARNAGAARGGAPWLLFIDADVAVPADLLDRYFESPVAEEVAVLAGGIADDSPDPGTPVSRFLSAVSAMSQSQTMTGEWAYAQTGNCAVRRAAFEAVGGFDDTVRWAGDADLGFRIRDRGWRVERREEAQVIHRTLTTLRSLIAQRSAHGSGCDWVNQRYPGSFPRVAPADLLRQAARETAAGVRALLRGNREEAARWMISWISSWAFEFGRRRRNVA
jgi:GT2 family glycosyltransferase